MLPALQIIFQFATVMLALSMIRVGHPIYIPKAAQWFGLASLFGMTLRRCTAFAQVEYGVGWQMIDNIYLPFGITICVMNGVAITYWNNIIHPRTGDHGIDNH